MRTLSIAALQTVPAFGDPDATLERFALTAVTLRRTIPPRAAPAAAVSATRLTSRRAFVPVDIQEDMQFE